MAGNAKSKAEFGDFQTPLSLAGDICALLLRRGVKPASVVEPNCGTGSFVLASLENFPTAKRAIAVDINAEHVATLQSVLEERSDSAGAGLLCSDFYDIDWKQLLQGLEDPLLVIGNPPWVTNAGLGAIGGSNLPEKSNFQRRAGLEAITGKSNFDISEWMLIRESEWLDGRTGTLAMLCKTAVARKVLSHAWKNSVQLSRSDVYLIDAMGHFGAAVDACLLVCDFLPNGRAVECVVHRGLKDDSESTFGLRDGRLVADVAAYKRWNFLRGSSEPYKWRSGIKHDCAQVVELHKAGRSYRNGLGEVLELEEKFLYPMLKGSQLANGSPRKSERWMIVTQRFTGEDTAGIREAAPKTWEYLERHARQFKRRASSVYKGRPQFCMFGVGRYSFAPWKIATSALYKKLEFKIVGPVGGKPVVLDDTCYFLACQSQEEAEFLTSLLNSTPAREFYNSVIFWDAKRPLTAEILRQLSFRNVANELGVEHILERYLVANSGDLFARTSP
jgi:hypothetical protein